MTIQLKINLRLSRQKNTIFVRILLNHGQAWTCSLSIMMRISYKIKKVGYEIINMVEQLNTKDHSGLPAPLNLGRVVIEGPDSIRFRRSLPGARDIGERADRLTHPHPELPIKYSDIDTALNRNIKDGSTIWLSSAETTPGPNITNAIRKRAEEIAKETGKTDQPVVTILTGVHTDLAPGLVNPGEKGPIQVKALFLGVDVRKMGQDPRTQCVVSMRDSDGAITRLENVPKKLWNKEIKPDVIIASVSGLKKDFFTLGEDGEATAELVGTLRDERRRDGKASTTLILVENENIPYTYGDTAIHYLEADAVVVDNRPIPEHKSAEKPEAVATAKMLAKAAIEMLDKPEYEDRPVQAQAGIGDGPGEVVGPIARHCKKKGVEFGMDTEVVGSYIIPLLDEGLIDGKVTTSFALGVSPDLKKRPEAYEIKRTSDINSVPAIERHIKENDARINKEREAKGLKPHEKQGIFIPVNWGTQIDLATGDVIAAQVPVYDENNRIKGYKVQAGHGGQRVMMEAGSKLGFSMIGIQAQREINGKKVPAFVFDREGAETTTPADFVTIYATKYGFYERKQLTGNIEQDRAIKQDNIRGLIGICAPEDRAELTRQAQERGLLPRREFTVYQNPFYAPVVFGVKAGFDMAADILKATREVYFPAVQH